MGFEPTTFSLGSYPLRVACAMKTKTIRLTRKVVTPVVTSVAEPQTESDASFQELHTIWNRATPNGKQVILGTIRAIAHIPGMANDAKV